jgi:hypothetical protein
VAASGARLRGVGRELDLLVNSRGNIKLPQIAKFGIVFIHASENVKLAVEIG